MGFSEFLQLNFAFLLSMIILLLFLVPSQMAERNVKKNFYVLIFLAIVDAIAHWIEIQYELYDTFVYGRIVVSVISFAAKIFFIDALIMIFIRNMDSRWNKRFLIIPAIIGTLIEATVLFAPWVYYYDEHNNFIRGPIYMIPNYIVIMYFFIPIYVAFRGLLKHEKWELITFIVVSAIILFTILYEVLNDNPTDIRETTIGLSILAYYMFFRSQMHMDEMENKEIEKQKAEEKVLTNIIKKTVLTLSYAVDAKDSYTNGHSTRVADYACRIAEMAGVKKVDILDVHYAGLLHDVGKIAIPEAIINKPTKLSEQEREIIMTHPVEGWKILKEVDDIPSLAEAARWHHERYDGKGYPDGLKGLEIPEIARIIAVADAYDAMTSKRSYRGVLPQEKVRQEIENGIGTQFDPKFARCMLLMIDADKDYQFREH